MTELEKLREKLKSRENVVGYAENVSAIKARIAELESAARQGEEHANGEE